MALQRQPLQPPNAWSRFTDKLIIQTDTQHWTTHRTKTTHSTSAGQIAGNGRAIFASIANNRIRTDRVNWPTGTQPTEAAYRRNMLHINPTLNGIDGRGSIMLHAPTDNLTHTRHLKPYN